MNTEANLDSNELSKFAELAPYWWDPEGACKPLHEINPLRLGFVQQHANLQGMRILDVGCGGGILSESLARAGASVTGIDATGDIISVARLHAIESSLPVEYRCTTVEALAAEQPSNYDIITCMEMLEHVPDPDSVIAACSRLLKPGGKFFGSTINRNPKSFLFAIVGAEYLLSLLPKGTHHYEHFIRPAELAHWLRRHDFELEQMAGMTYNPVTRHYRLSDDIDVNYLVYARLATS